MQTYVESILHDCANELDIAVGRGDIGVAQFLREFDTRHRICTTSLGAYRGAVVDIYHWYNTGNDVLVRFSTLERAVSICGYMGAYAQIPLDGDTADALDEFFSRLHKTQ